MPMTQYCIDHGEIFSFLISHLVPFCFIKLRLTLFSNQFSSGSTDMSDKIKRQNNQISLLHPQITGVST